MAQAKRPSRVKLVIGIIFSSEGVLIETKERLKKKFGSIDFASPLVPFDCTKYYEKEMGPGLKRQFLSFQRLIQPEKLAQIKLYTNRLERKASFRQRVVTRPINLDPGYISASKLVLATCKDYSHRIYLAKGIFAEVTLYFREGSFRPWPWTYPDYQSKGYLESFNAIRNIYMKQLSVQGFL